MTVKYGFLAWLLMGVPILGFIQYVRFKDRKKVWQSFKHIAHWQTGIAQSQSGQYFWQKVGLLVVLMLLILALMRPQYGVRNETIQRQGRQIYFVIDTSLSMLAKDGAPNRLELAKYHIQQLVSKLDQDTMALIPFANTGYVFLPLTSDVSAFHMFLDDISVGLIGSGGSDIKQAIQVVFDNMKARNQDGATLVVLSDGEFSSPIQKESIQQMQRGLNIQGIVVGIGSKQGEPLLLDNNQYKKDANGNIVISKRHDPALKTLADALNGTLIQGDVSPLVADKIYRALSKNETKLLEDIQKVTKIDRYHGLVLLALIGFVFGRFLPKLRQNNGHLFSGIIWCVCSSAMVASHPADKAYMNQDYSQAKTEYQAEIQQNPDQATVYYNLGNAYYKEGEYDQAIQAYQEARDGLSPDERIWVDYNLGTALLQKGKIPEAIKVYQNVLANQPDHQQAKQNLEWALRQHPPESDSSEPDENEDGSKNSHQDTPSSQPDDQQGEDQEKEDSDAQNQPEPEDDEAKKNTMVNPETISEQQIQYWVDQAEKKAREKKKDITAQLFEGSEW